MNAVTEAAVIKQHLIDPEVCIRCNTCEATCPVGAITHDSRNYVVDASKCNLCMACVPPCPTGSIDHWHEVVSVKAYTVAEQLTWDELPGLVSADVLAAAAAAAPGAGEAVATAAPAAQTMAAAPAAEAAPAIASSFGSTVPPWSAAHPYTNLYGPKAAQKTLTATVVGNVRVTAVGKDYDTHHLVLDFGSTPFPVLEGQSIGVVPPGVDASGRSHHARQYSVASPRNGERPGYNNVSLTIKRVLEDHSGQPVRGVASNFMCDAKVGDTVQVIGPFGTSFLMPNHPKSHIVMICTGTGSAPMRAMTEWRRRMAEKKQGFEGGRLLLFFGARSPEELPYFGPLQKLPSDFISTHFAYSRAPTQPKRYVQDAMRDRAADLVPLLSDPNAYFYVCGLKAMEEGVLAAMSDIATKAGLSWDTVGAAMKQQGRLHLETY
jgi:benzoyl-CoA 2,3-epoxidase subunit A